MAGERIRVRVVEKPKTRWLFALVLSLIGGFPDGEDAEIGVEVTDTVRRLHWNIPVFTLEKARRLQDQIVATASAMSDAEIDDWSSTGRWATFKG